jgi:Skp family chaperone for outer membrane proteins
MLLMKFLQNLKSSLLIVILISLCASPAFAQAKVAVVDLVRIYQEYSLVEEANRLITEGEEGLKRVITTAETEMKSLESKTGIEFDKKRDEVQSAVDDKVEEVQDLKETYNMKINRNIQDTVDKIAKKNSYLAILDKSFSVFAGEDITTQILSDLEKIK